MGVKSTVDLTRSEAIEMYLDLKKKLNKIYYFSNEYLEDELERMNDKYHGGEGFENYLIRD